MVCLRFSRVGKIKGSVIPFESTLLSNNVGSALLLAYLSGSEHALAHRRLPLHCVTSTSTKRLEVDRVCGLSANELYRC